jgi:phosphotransferase system enzyme I (PtsI)
MSFQLSGLAVSRGISIGRAVLMASSRVDVDHYFVEADAVDTEIDRLRKARDAVQLELAQLKRELPRDAPHELAALLDVHLMLLGDAMLADATKEWIQERRYNAEWALTAQLEVLSRQFDDMEDAYLRERKADVEQVVERMLRAMAAAQHDAHGSGFTPISAPAQMPWAGAAGQAGDTLIIVAHDISPADMLHFKKSVFGGFVTDIGGKTSHTAIVARSLDIPAVVGAREASRLIKQDDVVIVDGDQGLILVDPSPILLDEYRFRQREGRLARDKLARLRHTPAVTLDGQKIELLANIELPRDATAAVEAGAVGVGLFRSEFLFMNRDGTLPDEDEQFEAYRSALDAMQGLPVTIRTVDIGADKPLNAHASRSEHRGEAGLNPALGLRAIRWSLADPAMFTTQLRALLRASAFGKVRILFPMLAHAREIRQVLLLLDRARAALDAQGIAYGHTPIGAMIEVPAAALSLPLFARHFDFLSIGTNDLIQYTLAIDRADESVAHLYDAFHPAVLRLVADTIAAGSAAKATKGRAVEVSVCGEMAGDPAFTRFLLGAGLRSFSMHPSQVLGIKQEILRCDATKLRALAQAALASDDPQSVLATAT